MGISEEQAVFLSHLRYLLLFALLPMTAWFLPRLDY